MLGGGLIGRRIGWRILRWMVEGLGQPSEGIDLLVVDVSGEVTCIVKASTSFT
jgi:hypothetical protein